MSRGPVERLEESWERDGIGALALSPFAWAYGAAIRVRNALYDGGLLPTHELGLPCVSIGNLSVGGTGKTPVSAWVAQRLLSAGARPAILLRGYAGGDETLVHARLTPGAITVADPDRVRGAVKAKAAGAQVLVLDDAFQHRRARRDVDLVLVAAEQRRAHRLLPAGPLREGRRSLARARAMVVTRKSASHDEAEQTAREWGAFAPGATIAIVALVATGLERVGSPDPGTATTQGLDALRDRRVLAISTLGSPRAFESQLGALGAEVRSAGFPDHHSFADPEIAELARRAADTDLAVCTLKEAVKLEGRWPRQAPPLWYLSQAVEVERGATELGALLGRLAAASTA